MTEKDFPLRLAKLRLEMGVSARDMSLSIGQSPGYISSIKNGKALPSMSVFLCICEYLNITPYDFFDMENINPIKSSKLYNTAKSLSDNQLDNLIALAKDLHK